MYGLIVESGTLLMRRTSARLRIPIRRKIQVFSLNGARRGVVLN